MSHDVYISYSNKDKPKVDKVVIELEKRGIKCWIAPRDLNPGVPWGSAIVEALDNSQAVVAILSENANNSAQVTREIERAISFGLDVIPFRLDETTISGALDYFLSTAHWVDGFPEPIEEHINQLAETIQVYLGIEINQVKDESTEFKKSDLQIEEGKKGTIFKRLFNKAVTETPKSPQSSHKKPQVEAIAGNVKLKEVNSFEIQGTNSKSVIRFCIGDVTQASPDHAVDVLVTSAFRDDYYPVPGTVFGALYRKGISVDELAKDKEVDLRGAFSCWLSKEISDPPEGIHFNRLLCYEPSKSAKAGEQIGDIFRSLAPFIGGENPIRSVGTTLVAAGSSRRITKRESLELLVEASVH